MIFFIGDGDHKGLYGPTSNFIDMYTTHPGSDEDLFLCVGAENGNIIRKLAKWNNETERWEAEKLLTKIYILWLLQIDPGENGDLIYELYVDINNNPKVSEISSKYHWDGRLISTLYIKENEEPKYAYTFIPQDEGKDTDYGKLARNGHKILWVTKRLIGQQKGELIGGFEDGIWRNSGSKSIYEKENNQQKRVVELEEKVRLLEIQLETTQAGMKSLLDIY